MRIPSGKIDQVVYFVAVDSTDLKTRKTGLSAFTVYRSRNGAAATVYTTPTITELSAANMPGVYSLLIDEDTTIASTSDSEEQALHITCATMAPVTRVLELYRRDTTSGRTLSVDANSRVDLGSILGTAVATPATPGVLDINVKNIANAVVNTANAQIGVNVVNAAGTAWNSGAITASTFAAGAITAAKFAANALDAVWSTATRLLTAGTNIVLTKGVGVTGFNDLDAPGIRAAVGLAAANLDTQLATFATAANLTTTNNNVLAAYNRIGAPVGATISADILADFNALTAQIAALSAGSGMDSVLEPGITVRQGQRLMLSVLAGQASGLGTPTVAFRDVNNTADRVVATVDQWGNRSTVALNGGA
jgi:hypothetical protein